MSATQFVIRSTTKRGVDTYCRNGASPLGPLAIFHSRKHAQSVLNMLEPGLDDAETAVVVPLAQVPRGIHREQLPDPKPKAARRQRKK